MKTSTTHLLGRAASALIAAGACAVAVAPASFAASSSTTPSVPSSADVAAARQVVEAAPVMHRVAGFLAHGGQPAKVNSAAAERQAEAVAAPKLVGATVPVYYLNPAFVKERSASVPVARLAFMATEAVSADGQRASIWTMQSKAPGHPWKQFNIASGSDETDAAAAAARHGADAIAFYEPQIHAWYVLDDGRVTGINKDGQKSVGSTGMTVAAYQALVHQRYGDKLPGSDYARNHMVGGFDYDPVLPAAAGSGSGTPAQATLVGGGAAAVLGAGAFTMRRRRARRDNA
jgi:hypothetical protein